MFLNNPCFYIKNSINNNILTNKLLNLFKTTFNKITQNTISIYNNNSNCFNNSNNCNNNINNNINNVLTVKIALIVKQQDFIENFQKRKE